MNHTPHKHLITVARMLQAASRELSALTETLLPGTTKPKRAYTRIAKPAIQVSAKVIQIKAAKPAKKAPVGRSYLSESDREAIKVLLTQTDISVGQIASMYRRSRAAIYNLRDKLNLDVRRGSAALMAGIRRAAKLNPVEEPVIPAGGATA